MSLVGETGRMVAPAQPIGIHHVSVNVHDAEEAAGFYVDVLGFTRRDDRPDFGVGGAWLDVGGQQLHLIETTVPDPCGQHFAIEVADLDRTVARLRDAGVEIGDPSAVGTGRQAFLADPSGNQIELHERGT